MGEIVQLVSEHFSPPKKGTGKDVCAMAKAVARARECGVSYKVLMTLTGYGRTRLDQLRKLAASL